MCGMSLNGLNEGRNEELMSTHNIYFREELLFEKKKKKKKIALSGAKVLPSLSSWYVFTC